MPDKPNDSQRIISQINPDYSTQCGATSQPWIASVQKFSTDDGRLPKFNNRIQGSLALSPNAPDYCKSMFTSKTIDSAKNSCIWAFSVIGASCDVRGGTAENECGTWTENVCDIGTGTCFGKDTYLPATTVTPPALPTQT